MAGTKSDKPSTELENLLDKFKVPTASPGAGIPAKQLEELFSGNQPRKTEIKTVLGEEVYAGYSLLKKTGPLFKRGTLLILKAGQEAYSWGVNSKDDFHYIPEATGKPDFLLRKGAKLTVLKEGIVKMFLPACGNVAMRYIKVLTTVGDGEYEEYEKQPKDSGSPMYCSVLVNPELTYETIQEHIGIFEGHSDNTKDSRKYTLEEIDTTEKKKKV
jgi:hypothetical protein